MATTKILIKLQNKSAKQPKWVHVCYVDRDLFEAYKKHLGKSPERTLNDELERWARQTLGEKDIKVSTVQEFLKLKTLVKDYYKNLYPSVYIDSPTDRQGWMRVWVTDMLKEGAKNVSRKKSV